MTTMLSLLNGFIMVAIQHIIFFAAWWTLPLRKPVLLRAVTGTLFFLAASTFVLTWDMSSITAAIIGTFLKYILYASIFIWMNDISFWEALYYGILIWTICSEGYNILFFISLYLPFLQQNRIISMISSLIISLICAVILYLVQKRLPRIRGTSRENRSLALIALFTAAPLNLLSFLLVSFTNNSQKIYLLCAILINACILLALHLVRAHTAEQRLLLDNQALRQTLHQKQREYERSSEMIALINQKSHDLKYQIAALKQTGNADVRNKYIQDLEETVDLYDRQFQTGSPVLDTILIEKSLLCRNKGILLKCQADGSLLSFLDVVDLYTILGNALDNAIEYLSSLSEPENAGENLFPINVFAYQEKQMIVLRIENYYEGSTAEEGQFPASTKENNGYHGFGLKGLQDIVQKYHGVLQIRTDVPLFLLTIIFPRKAS